jgi:DNA-binding MarR family transcriptional regulator
MRQTRTAALQDLEREVGVLLRRVKRVIAERATEVHPELQPTSYLMLGWIAEQGPVRASALAGEFHVDKGAVSRTVQHLEELGLLDRKPDPADGRASLVTASADAVRRLAGVDERRRDWFKERLNGWTVADLSDLAAALGRYNDTLD